MNGTPIYTSKRAGKNLWPEYRVYPGRLDLQSRFLFHTLVIPVNEILGVEVRAAEIIWSVNLDNCNFCRHVLLHKKSGLFKRIGFTPDDPEKFVNACHSIRSGQ